MQAIRNFATSRHLALIGLIVACALSRLLPHPWNFSPIESVALFAGACFASRAAAVLVPLAAMLLSIAGLLQPSLRMHRRLTQVST